MARRILNLELKGCVYLRDISSLDLSYYFSIKCPSAGVPKLVRDLEISLMLSRVFEASHVLYDEDGCVRRWHVPNDFLEHSPKPYVSFNMTKDSLFSGGGFCFKPSEKNLEILRDSLNYVPGDFSRMCTSWVGVESVPWDHTTHTNPQGERFVRSRKVCGYCAETCDSQGVFGSRIYGPDGLVLATGTAGANMGTLLLGSVLPVEAQSLGFWVTLLRTSSGNVSVEEHGWRI